ncbi:18054_t:CDS:2 [Entrophospora sp. SA101]|nr:18054_t:CDS:2 [Entrophospora sp. SA101]
MSSLGKATHLWNYRFRFSSITDDDDNNDDETVDLLSKTYIDRSHDVYQDEITPLPEEISKVSDLNKTDFKLKKKNSFNDFNNNNVDGYQSKKRSMSTASEPCRMTRYASISSNKQKKDSYLGTSESYVISELSHPMCQEYTEMLLDSLGKQLTDTSKEHDCYKDFLKKIKNKELAATDMLKDIKHEREVLKKELEKLETETNQLDELEGK